MSLYSDGIIFKFRFQKSRFIEEIGKSSRYFLEGVYLQLATKVLGHLAVYGVKWPFSRGRGR